jgi:hypothetical protein
MNRTRWVLLACMFWLAVGLIAIAGQKAGIWSTLPWVAKYYGENTLETP